MKIESEIRFALENAGYRFVRKGKHLIYRNDRLNHVIVVPSSTHDGNAVNIVKGLINRGIRQSQINR